MGGPPVQMRPPASGNKWSSDVALASTWLMRSEVPAYRRDLQANCNYGVDHHNPGTRVTSSGILLIQSQQASVLLVLIAHV